MLRLIWLLLKKRKLVDILTRVSTSHFEFINTEERCQDELTRYLQLLQPELKSDPLQWWKSHESQFPILAMLAKNICQCAPSERVFSTSGNIITSKRSCVKPDKVDKLVF